MALLTLIADANVGVIYVSQCMRKAYGNGRNAPDIGGTKRSVWRVHLKYGTRIRRQL